MSFVSLAGSVLRCAAIDGSRSPDWLIRVLGRGGSSSRMIRRISSSRCSVEPFAVKRSRAC